MSTQRHDTHGIRLRLCNLPVSLMVIFALSVCADAQSAGGPARDRPNERLGINPWDVQSFLSDIPGYVSTNVGSIRIDLPWQKVQPRPEVFNWEELDAAVSAAQANRMDV